MWCRDAASSRWTCARPPTPSATRWWPTSWPSWTGFARGAEVRLSLEETMRVSAAPVPRLAGPLGAGAGDPGRAHPSHAQWRRPRRHETARTHAAGHAVCAGQNAGISHNPLEATTSDDMQLAVDAFATLLRQLAADQQPH